MNEKLKNDNDRLRNQNNKNSSNSSKSSSTDSFKPKRTGANLYNYRLKTDRKPGGQFGHKGSHLSKKKVEKLIKDNKIEVKTFEHIIKGNSKKENTIKYKENHLYFIKDFEVRFDNNISESDLRMFKIKTKISGGFRSINSANDYMNTLSIIKTSIKRNINPFESIKSIFNNEILFQS